MESHFDEVTTDAELEQVFRRSEQALVLLYLHDPYCGLSTIAHAEVSALGLPVPWIDVHARHNLGMEVERLTGVNHESPQALVLRDRQARWSASHRNLTAASILVALEAAEKPGAISPPRSRRDHWSALRSALPRLRRRSSEL